MAHGEQRARPAGAVARLRYERRVFAWARTAALVARGSAVLYATVWAALTSLAVVPHAVGVPIVAVAAGASILPPARTCAPRTGVLPILHGAERSLCVLLSGSHLVSPLAHGTQMLMRLVPSMCSWCIIRRVLVLSSGAQGHADRALRTMSSAAHGGAWGFARVLRIEHVGVRTQSVDAALAVAIGSNVGSAAAQSEDEQALSLRAGFAARLRVCAASSARCVAVIAAGLHTITGGLGGLGVRAAVLLLERGATRVMLASRSARVMCDGGQLASQLEPTGRAVEVVTCDIGDLHEARSLLGRARSLGLLHAAGTLRDQLARLMIAADVDGVLASKATSAAHVHQASTRHSIESVVLFSSVSSTFGNVGQASYATANAYLDAVALGSGSIGAPVVSLQITAIAGAGMGALTFSKEQLDAIGGVGLDEFARCLSRLLMPARASSESTQAMLTPVMLDNVQAARLGTELSVASTRPLATGGTPVSPSTDPLTGWLRDVASVPAAEGHMRVEAAVLRVVRELVGTCIDQLHARATTHEPRG